MCWKAAQLNHSQDKGTCRERLTRATLLCFFSNECWGNSHFPSVVWLSGGFSSPWRETHTTLCAKSPWPALCSHQHMPLEKAGAQTARKVQKKWQLWRIPVEHLMGFCQRMLELMWQTPTAPARGHNRYLHPPACESYFFWILIVFQKLLLKMIAEQWGRDMWSRNGYSFSIFWLCYV